MNEKQINQKLAYIMQEIKKNLEKFDKGASRNQKRTMRGRVAILLSTWIATSLIGLINFQLPSPWEIGLKIAAFVFSAISTGVTTWMQTGDFEERGTKYSLRASNTRNELFRFNTGIGEYKDKDMSEVALP